MWWKATKLQSTIKYNLDSEKFWVYMSTVYYDAKDRGYYGVWRNITPNCSVGHFERRHIITSQNNFKNLFQFEALELIFQKI